MNKCNVLIGMVGMSPAVLTETIWALAQGENPWIPGKVVVITTTEGTRVLREKLLDSGEWEHFRKKLGAGKDQLRFGAADTIRVIGDNAHDFSDIDSREANEATADFILDVLRQHTENPNTQIVASIAGGRKTMSALMLSCMSLLGREQDRVCHVLANDDFIFANKGFLFPQTPAEETQAQIILSDLPFVRVRGLYAEKLDTAPASYSDMVSLFHKAAPPAINYPKIKLDLAEGKIFADDEDLKLSPKEFLLAAVLIEHFIKKGKPFSWWGDVQEKIASHEAFEERWADARWSAVASDIRKKRLKGKPWSADLMPAINKKSNFPKSKIKIRTSADIRKSPKKKKSR